MAFKHSSVNNADSPGIASDQGVAHWAASEDSEIVAVTDTVHTQREFGVVIYPLVNDIGENLIVTSASIRDSNYGTVTFTDSTVTFTPAGVFDSIECGAFQTITIDYSIADDKGNTDSGFIIVYVTNQSQAWVDEDGFPVADEDLAWTALCGEIIFEWWMSESDDEAIIDEDEFPLVSEL